MSARRSQSIFVCYRRIDSADAVDRIYELLEKGFSRRGLFRDIDSMPYGIDFPSYITKILETCSVALVVIGPAWLDARSENGSRRLDDPRDHVRLEIATALCVEGLRVIPVLVRNASMPTAEQLPDSIQGLAGRSGLSVRPGPDFRNDMSRLVKHLRQAISEVRQLRSQQIGLSGVRDKITVAWRNAKRFRHGVQIFWVLLASLVLLVFGTVSYFSSTPALYKEAQKYLMTKDYEKAMPLLLRAAATHDPGAMLTLGNLYRNGIGVQRDMAKALDWYQKAREAAHNTDAEVEQKAMQGVNDVVNRVRSN